MSDPALSDLEFSRYSRHLLLPEIDVEGQQRLKQAHALIIGAGGLGCPVASYLASSGVGQITLYDPDQIDLGNLQRQTVFRTEDVGRDKATVLAQALSALNPEINVTPVVAFAAGEVLREAVAAADVVIDASDNFNTRFAINATCVAERKALVSGAAVKLQGQVTLFRCDLENSPCYHCLYQTGEEAAQSCAEHGVFAPLVGIVGALQATEALKLIIGFGESLLGRLLLIDAQTMQFRTLQLPQDPACPCCATR